jgi:deazaflavin-dependent oxidoreductase (nitroreductase family)
MASDATERVAKTAPVTPEPVGPSLMVRVVMRPMTKVLNPLILKLAGRRHFRMAAQIRHVGRRSMRAYATPVSARRKGDLVLIALTFGNQSDWARNVRAAGGCSIRIEGRDYDLTRPQFLTMQEAKPLATAAFSRMERAGFRMLGIKQIMRLDVVPAEL